MGGPESDYSVCPRPFLRPGQKLKKDKTGTGRDGDGTGTGQGRDKDGTGTGRGARQYEKLAALCIHWLSCKVTY